MRKIDLEKEQTARWNKLKKRTKSRLRIIIYYKYKDDDKITRIMPTDTGDGMYDLCRAAQEFIGNGEISQYEQDTENLSGSFQVKEENGRLRMVEFKLESCIELYQKGF